MATGKRARAQRDDEHRRLGEMIDATRLSDRQKLWLRSRWLDQVTWMDRRAELANRWHYLLRIVAICGGVLVPALVSLHATGPTKPPEGYRWFWSSIGPAVFIVSILVAMSVALEGFFRWGDRWRHYRRTAELLLGEGWSYLGGAKYFVDASDQSAGKYHATNFPGFVHSVEALIRQDVDSYLSTIAKDLDAAQKQGLPSPDESPDGPAERDAEAEIDVAPAVGGANSEARAESTVGA